MAFVFYQGRKNEKYPSKNCSV